MKTAIKKAVQGLLLVPLVAFGLSFVTVGGAYAAPGDCPGLSNLNNATISSGADCAAGNTNKSDLTTIFKTVTNVLLYIVGAIAVIVLIFGGIRYVTSGGNQTSVTAAKNTILYAIIGIIVALLAYVIVNFVITAISSSGNA